MSYLPRSFITADPTTSFQPLFRLLDDFERHSQGGQSTRSHLKTFTPRFDLKEVKTGYELHGELPGIEQKDIDIEFTDSNTLTIKGRTERSYTSGAPPTGFIEGESSKGAIEGAHNGHKATVEDVNEGAEGSTEITKAKKDEPKAPKEPEAKYWVSERSVGEFQRSFTFPESVDHDGVKASMKNGILTIIVPKAKKPEARKITIS